MEDRNVASHAAFLESFEDQSGEELQVNNSETRFFLPLSVEEIRMFQTCTDRSRSVVGLLLVFERLKRCVLRASARRALSALSALVERGFVFFLLSSVVNSFSFLSGRPFCVCSCCLTAALRT